MIGNIKSETWQQFTNTKCGIRNKNIGAHENLAIIGDRKKKKKSDNNKNNK